MSVEISIKKKFKGFNLDIEFTHSRNCMGILGASGCGKSMTLKCIAGIETPDSGKIVLNDRVLFDSSKKINIKPQERRVGYLFQNYALFPNMTVEENIGIGIKLSKEQKNQIVQNEIEKFRLKGLEKRYPYELSGGQQQRTALARIMAYKPDIIMLDEPFSALDSYLKETLQQQLIESLNDYAGDVIIVSHSRDEIYRFCDCLTIMDDGKQLLTGETKQIFKAPVKMEAAKLTGCRNISPAKKIGDYEIYADDWEISLKTEEKVKDSLKYVGIRAHSIKPSSKTEENCMKVLLYRTAEQPFEIQYILKNANEKESGELLWKLSKNDAGEQPYADNFPEYVKIPGEKILLLE